jgi:two-component system, chemotaxis family, CheB/CheR fusion protein
LNEFPENLPRQEPGASQDSAGPDISRASDSEEASASASESSGFPIVGIGASAGGLEAISQLLSKLPARTGMAFIVIQHLDPHQKSHLVELLSKASFLAVVEITNGMRLEPERVHVIPPNCILTLEGLELQLTPREPGPGAHMPINLFMRSLAEAARDKSIGIILSGTGTDGTLGLSEIKAAGGVTFVQDPNSARHGGMPQSAVAEGVVDYVLAPGEIAEELAGISHHPYFSPEREGENRSHGEEGDFGKIIRLLRGSSGVDFTHYRDTTLKRRIMRRMALHKLESTAEYAKLLKGNPAELQALYQEILINVTRFFRDPQVFEALKAKVFPEIHKSKPAGSPIRIWVAGCASGEEAYSLAIALYEYQDGEPYRPPIRIFATDISETPSLERARAALYPDSIETDVSPERLRRFFTKEAMGYRINKDIRDLCTFARHNVTVDPPFSKVDLLSCRNLLIYLGAPLQRKVLPTFHYALNASGFLLLGNSETVGRESELFNSVDAKMKIYSKKFTNTRTPISFSQDKPILTAGLEKVRSIMTMPSDYEKMADRVLLRRFAPSGVLVNRDMDILQFRGRTSPYLEPPQGDAKFNLVKMAQEILFLELRNAIQECDRTNAVVIKRGVRIRDGRQIREVNLEVIPVRPPDTGENCFLILFDESESVPQDGEAGKGQTEKATHSAGDEMSQLRLELNAARDYLQTIREQHDAVNEELKSSNEEILSSNEELQSTNEELETAKEELQSTNEELSTMNDELRSRNQELNQVNNDLNNLIGSVNVPIVMLGNDLRIRKFTPSAAKLMEFKPQDVGLAIVDTHSFLNARELELMAREVIISVVPVGKEVQDRDGRWYVLKILPYRTSDNRIDGAVLVLTDIDDSKRAQEQLKELAAFTGSIVATVREPILILDKDLRIQSVNAAFYQTFGGTPQDTEYHLIYTVGQGRWNIPELRTLLEDIIPQQSSFQDFEVEIDVQGNGRRVFKLNARLLAREENGKKLILLAFEDFTENREALRSSEERYRMLFETAYDMVLMLDAATGRILGANPSASKLSGFPRNELLGKGLWELGPFGSEADCLRALGNLKHANRLHYANVPIRTREGNLREVEMINNIYSSNGQLVVQCNIRDITERRRADRELKMFKFICDQSNDPYYLMQRDGRLVYVNLSAYSRLGYTESELLAMAMQDVDPDLAGGKIENLFDQALHDRVPPFESKHVTRAQEEVPVECLVTGLKYEGDSYLLLVARETTERIKAQAALQASEDRLRQSQKMEDIGKLAGGVAHDFNNLLTAINGYTEICQAQLRPEDPLQENLREIRKAGERASSLTRKLLAYSRKQVLAPKVFNLNFVIADMQHMLTSLVGERIKIVTELEPGLEQVKADTGEVEQVLLNLVVNARDAMPEGGTITVETRNVEAGGTDEKADGVSEGTFVMLSVTDTGTGMDEKTKHRIFDPFFTTKDVGKGSGLGLSMVQGMIAQSGGHIELDSELGKGTSFRIYLPAFKTEDYGFQMPESGSSSLSGKETILLVDDEDMVRVLTRQILSMYGYVVLEARDGREALSIAEQYKGAIHMLLSDLVMPGMNGRQLAEKFSELRPDSQVLFMSGYAHDVILNQDLGMRGFTYVQKPFTPTFLAKSVREALGQESTNPKSP